MKTGGLTMKQNVTYLFRGTMNHGTMDSPLTEELFTIYQDAGWLETTGYGHLVITGPDAAAWLQRLVSNEVVKRPIGEGCYAALLDRKGQVLSWFYLLRRGDEWFHLISPPPLAGKTEQLFRKYKVIERVQLQNQSTEWQLIRVLGKQANQTVAGLFEEDPALIENRFTPLSGGGFWKEGIYQEPVWNILIPTRHDAEIKKVLSPLKKIGAAAFEIFRQKSGIPAYGIDVDEQHTLLEANMHYAYQRFKGCYPGQEVVERILAYGNGRTPRTLVTLYFPHKNELPAGTPLKTPAGEEAGHITSACYDPHSDQTVVLAYVDWKFKETPLKA